MESLEAQFAFPSKGNHAASYGICEHCLISMSYLLVILFCPLAVCMCIKSVGENERAVIFRLGRLKSSSNCVKGPGSFYIIPCIDEYKVVDMTAKSLEVPTQVILTKDGIEIQINADVHYRITEPEKTVDGADRRSAQAATIRLVEDQLCNWLSNLKFSEIVSDPEHIARTLTHMLERDPCLQIWGLTLDRIEIKDVVPPTGIGVPADGEKINHSFLPVPSVVVTHHW